MAFSANDIYNYLKQKLIDIGLEENNVMMFSRPENLETLNVPSAIIMPGRMNISQLEQGEHYSGNQQGNIRAYQINLSIDVFLYGLLEEHGEVIHAEKLLQDFLLSLATQGVELGTDTGIHGERWVLFGIAESLTGSANYSKELLERNIMEIEITLPVTYYLYKTRLRG